MARFRVTTRQLRDQADKLETMNNKFAQAVNKLREGCASLGSKWEGPARDKFVEEFNKDAEKFDLFKNGITTFINQLRTDANEYDKTEEANRAIAATRKA